MFLHKTVLLNESIKALKIKKNGIYIDGTFGCGGHSKIILKYLNKKGLLYAFDKDTDVIKYAKKIHDNRFKIIYKSFSKIKKYTKNKNIQGKINGILLDLGLSSNQLFNKNKGFSFQINGNLDMRINQKKNISIKKWINQNNEKKIYLILKKYGNEKFSYRIAKAINNAKKIKNITTTKKLVNIIKQAIPKKKQILKSLKRTFLAFRVYINKEIQELKNLLKHIESILAPKGRLVIITFNSLEDKIVKKFMKKQSSNIYIPPEIPIKYKKIKKLHNIKFKIFKKIKPNIHEKYYNSKSRNAILRIMEKL